MNTLELLGRGPRRDSDVRCPPGRACCYYRDWSWLPLHPGVIFIIQRSISQNTITVSQRYAGFLHQTMVLYPCQIQIYNKFHTTLEYIFYYHEAASCEPEWSMLNVSKLPVNNKPETYLKLSFGRSLLKMPAVVAAYTLRSFFSVR